MILSDNIVVREVKILNLNKNLETNFEWKQIKQSEIIIKIKVLFFNMFFQKLFVGEALGLI